MSMNFTYAYAIIEKATCWCSQVIQTNTPNWSIDNEHDYSIQIPAANSEQYAGKYYYNNQWWERIWNELDSEGFPIESSGYTDVPWTPEA